MDDAYEEIDFEDREELFSPKLLFSFPVIINSNKTDVTFNCCRKGSPDEYYAVNLVRNGSCVNSFTMLSRTAPQGGGLSWRFEEDSVPKELKARESEFSAAINKSRN
jgi:hypothetical protein